MTFRLHAKTLKKSTASSLLSKVIFSSILLSISLIAEPLKTYGCGVTKNAFQTKLNAAYAKKMNKEVIIVGRGGCPKGIKLINSKKVDIASGCRPPIGIKGEENVKAHIVAWGALVAIVNVKNPISNITTQQFKDILKGKITSWKEVGGKDELIQVYARSGKISGVGHSIRTALFDDKDAIFTKFAKKKGSSGPIRRAVSKGLNIFAVDDYGTSSRNKRIKMLSIDGVKPSKETIKDGSYSLYKPLYIYSHGKPKGENKKFIDFALSDEGQKIISDNGLVTVKEGKHLKIKH